MAFLVKAIIMISPVSNRQKQNTIFDEVEVHSYGTAVSNGLHFRYLLLTVPSKLGALSVYTRHYSLILLHQFDTVPFSMFWINELQP